MSTGDNLYSFTWEIEECTLENAWQLILILRYNFEVLSLFIAGLNFCIQIYTFEMKFMGTLFLTLSFVGLALPVSCKNMWSFRVFPVSQPWNFFGPIGPQCLGLVYFCLLATKFHINYLKKKCVLLLRGIVCLFA